MKRRDDLEDKGISREIILRQLSKKEGVRV
jgi:hypothetical protein